MRSVEVAKTVLEVADVAWTAVEHTHHYRRHSHSVAPFESADDCPSDHDLKALRSENRRLRNLLDQNLKLLQNLSESPCLDNCPPDVLFKFQLPFFFPHFIKWCYFLKCVLFSKNMDGISISKNKFFQCFILNLVLLFFLIIGNEILNSLVLSPISTWSNLQPQGQFVLKFEKM